TPEQREQLALVRASAESLLTIVNDILDFSKIEAGRLDLDPTEFQLRETVDDALAGLAVRAHEKQLELLCEVAPDVPDTLVADANATNRRIFEKTFHKWRMAPTLVDSGSAAIEAVFDAEKRGQPFDLVLLDVNMPGMDGFATAGELRDRADGAVATIMMVTS